jgi:hypothetical protein
MLDVFAVLKATREEMEERNDAINLRAVKRGCICPNHAQPDENGVSYFSPCCQVDHHGLKSPSVRWNPSYGGFFQAWEERDSRRPQPKRQRCRLPGALSETARLGMMYEAIKKIAAQLEAHVSA